MKASELKKLLGDGNIANDIICAARVMLGRGQSNVAYTVLTCGLLCAGMSPMHHYEPSVLFEALEDYTS